MDKRELSRPALTNERVIEEGEITQSQTLGTDKEQEIWSRNSVAASNETSQQKCMDIQSEITNIVTMVSESFKKFQILQQTNEDEKLAVPSMLLNDFISRIWTSDSTISSILKADTVSPSRISFPQTSENIRINSTSKAPSVRRSAIIEDDNSASFGGPTKKAKTNLTHTLYDYGSTDGIALKTAAHNEITGPFSSLIKRNFLSDVMKEDDDYDIYNDDYHCDDKGVGILRKVDFGRNKTEPYRECDTTDISHFPRKQRVKIMLENIQSFFKNNPVKVDVNMSTSERMDHIRSSKFFSDEFSQTHFINKPALRPGEMVLEAIKRLRKLGNESYNREIEALDQQKKEIQREIELKTYALMHKIKLLEQNKNLPQRNSKLSEEDFSSQNSHLPEYVITSEQCNITDLPKENRKIQSNLPQCSSENLNIDDCTPNHGNPSIDPVANSKNSELPSNMN